MTKLEREGLEVLMGLLKKGGVNTDLRVPTSLNSVNAAIDWLHRQMALDDKRRRKRGQYRKR